MKKLYRFNFDCGRMGTLTGLFVCDTDTLEGAIGKDLYFGEVLGKHSEVMGPLEDDDIQAVSDDQEFIEKLVEILGESVSGYNPLDYLQEDMD